MRPLFLLLILASVAPAQERPGAKFPIAKDTTLFVQPLTNNGYVDYGKVVNERLGEGIRPDQNAMALLVQAFGHAEEKRGVPEEFFKLIGGDIWRTRSR